MPHGHPDYGLETVKETVHAVTDLGELAARLGSIDTFDRRGDVIWFDDFESDVYKWVRSITGAGGTMLATAERARNGGFCCELLPSRVAGTYTQMTHFNPYPVLSKLGFEISFTRHDEISEYLFVHELYDGVDDYSASIRFLTATNVLEVNDNGVWREFADNVVLYENSYHFNTFKIVADFQTIHVVAGVPERRYLRLILNEVEYPLSNYALLSTAAGLGVFLRSYLRVTAAVDDAYGTFVDDAILTQNEP